MTNVQPILSDERSVLYFHPEAEPFDEEVVAHIGALPNIKIRGSADWIERRIVVDVLVRS